VSSESASDKKPSSFFSWKYLVLSLLLSLASMAVVVYITYDPEVWTYLKPKRFPGLVIAIVVSIMRLWFQAAKIRFLADNELSWLAAFRVVLSWDFTSSVTPSTVGGAPMATYAMSKEGIRMGKSSAIMIYSVLTDQIWFALTIPILIVIGFYLPVVPQNIGWVGESTMFLIYAALLSYAGLLAYGVFKNPAGIKRVVKAVFRLPLLRKYRDSVEEEAENLEIYASKLRNKPISFLIKAMGLTALTWLARIWLPTIVILSMLPADVLLSFLRSMSMNYAFLVMPTPGGSGGVEGLFAIFQGPLIDRKVFIGISVFLWRVISYYISIGLGMMATTWYINQSVVEKTSNQDD
jgi:uncharacterized protein (TIRG00374 family)